MVHLVTSQERPGTGPAGPGSLVGRVGRWIGAGLELLCPAQCPLCGAETGGAAACGGCRRVLDAEPRRCLRCGATGGCHGCRRIADGVVILGGYADGLRLAVLRGKRPAGEPTVAALGRLLVERHRDTLDAWRIDVVVPVPMHWTRRCVRGTNAAVGLADAVAAALGVRRRALVRRIRATPMQNRLPAEGRPANVRGALCSRPAAGARVLVVDDVTTTGATLAECRRMLAAAGAEAVYAAAVARADRGGDAED